MNVYNADSSRHRHLRAQPKVLQVEPNTDMNVYNAVLSYHRNIGEERRDMQEVNPFRYMNDVYAFLCRHRDLDEQRRKMPKPSDLLNNALDAINTIVDCVALVAEEEDNATMNINMNMDMNTASSTITNGNSPSNNHNPIYNNFQPSASQLLLSSSSTDFQQHLQQLQQQQQMKHELHKLQKRQQELVQMMGTNTTTMTQKYNCPYAPMSIPMSQIQQENKKEQQQQLQSSTAIASVTLIPPVTQKKAVNLGRTKFTNNLTEEAEEPTRTVDNNNTVPSEWDILIGRGRGVDNHTGNMYYRKVVESFRKQYEAIAQKGGKTKFIRDVVDIIYENGYQFVKKVKDPNIRNGSATTTSTCTSWVPVDRDVARDKVSNSFRNAKRLQTASACASASTNNN